MLWAISRVAAPRFVVMREQNLQAHLNYLPSRKSIPVVSGVTLTDNCEEMAREHRNPW